MICVLSWLRWKNYQSEYREARLVDLAIGLSRRKAKCGILWTRMCRSTATVAYSNQFMIYPFYGFDLQRRVIYAPVRRRGFGEHAGFFRTGFRIVDLFQKAIDAANAPGRSVGLDRKSASDRRPISCRSGARDQRPGNRAGPRPIRHQFVRSFSSTPERSFIESMICH